MGPQMPPFNRELILRRDQIECRIETRSRPRQVQLVRFQGLRFLHVNC